MTEYAYTTEATPSGTASTKSYGYDLAQPDRLFLLGLKRITVWGKVVHISNFKSQSLKGYIVYIEEQPNSLLTAFWIDENALIGEGVKEMLENKMIGNSIEIKRLDTVPFKNPSCIIQTAFSVNITSSE